MKEGETGAGVSFWSLAWWLVAKSCDGSFVEVKLAWN